MVEAHRCSAKHQGDSFHETESSQTFLKYAVPDFADNYFLLQTYRLDLILYMNMLCIPHFN